MSTLRIFDIQRCSLVDGPGLRTTVFFMGCNLHCKWCHNPESQTMETQLMFHAKRCTSCGICREVCPTHLKSCTLCGKCADYCPSGAREIVGKTVTTKEIFTEIEKDRSFYNGSGGGATFSGGECMLQIDTLAELLQMCSESGIHTAVDTAGCVPRKSFETVLAYTSLFLYDMKCYDDILHQKFTGVSNKLILDNLAWLSEKVPEKITVRIPIIPGFNNTDKELKSMAGYIKNHGLSSVELLPYHKLGEHKYEDLGKKYDAFTVPTNTEMSYYRSFFD